jgi:hypothetical protein
MAFKFFIFFFNFCAYSYQDFRLFPSDCKVVDAPGNIFRQLGSNFRQFGKVNCCSIRQEDMLTK